MIKVISLQYTKIYADDDSLRVDKQTIKLDEITTIGIEFKPTRWLKAIYLGLFGISLVMIFFNEGVAVLISVVTAFVALNTVYRFAIQPPCVWNYWLVITRGRRKIYVGRGSHEAVTNAVHTLREHAGDRLWV
jgi:hypothetical protein